MMLAALTRARIGTSEAAKRIEAAARAAEVERMATAERHRRAAEEQRRLAEEERHRLAMAEPVALVDEQTEWRAREILAWAQREPNVVMTIKPRWRTIVEEVAARHGLTVEETLSHSRVRKLIRPRFEIMYRLYDETPLSYPEIGRRLGGRDHTTVLHGVRTHAALNGLPMPRQDEENAA